MTAPEGAASEDLPREGEPAAAEADRVSGADIPLPLTERVLARLGRPWLLWALVWASLPVVVHFGALALTGMRTFEVWETVVGGAYVNLFGLWALRRFGRALQAARPHLARLTGDDTTAGRFAPFRAFGSVTGPLLLNLAAILPFRVADYLRDPRPAVLLAVSSL